MKYTLTTINTLWEATQRVMAAKLATLTHKIAIQLHLVAESCTICVLAPGGQSGNFWTHPRVRDIYDHLSCLIGCDINSAAETASLNKVWVNQSTKIMLLSVNWTWQVQIRRWTKTGQLVYATQSAGRRWWCFQLLYFRSKAAGRACGGPNSRVALPNRHQALPCTSN
jgi:hypothetical protein